MAMSIFVASQDSYGELYQDLLRCPVFDVSSDDNAECDKNARLASSAGSLQVVSHFDSGGSPSDAASSSHICGGGEGAGSLHVSPAIDVDEVSPAVSAVNMHADEGDPIEATPAAELLHIPARARTPRLTKWGRCIRCDSPMRLVYPATSGGLVFWDAPLSRPRLLRVAATRVLSRRIVISNSRIVSGSVARY